jgi:hypothetical protein
MLLQLQLKVILGSTNDQVSIAVTIYIPLHEELGSYLAQNTGYPDWVFSSLVSSGFFMKVAGK